MNRPAVALLAAALSAPGCSDSTDAPAAPDHVVLVTIDTLRADHLPMYGYPRNTSPFLLELADRGAVFEEAISASSQTAPSHGSILTARYPSQHGAIENGRPLDRGFPTLAGELLRHGFDTGAVISIGFLRKVGRGFQHLSHFEGDERRGGPKHRPAAETVALALDWVERREEGRPFFLWVHVFDVHEHRKVETIDPESLRAADQAIADSGVSDDEFVRLLREAHGTDIDVYFRRPENALEQMRRYDATILQVDRALKTLYEGIERGPRRGRGLWIVTADHGEGLGSHGYGGHDKHLYREQLRVPLVVHYSDDRLRGVRVPEVVRTVDIFPTVMEALGLDMPPSPQMGHADLDPRSLLPLASRDRASEAARLAFAQRKPVNDADLERGWFDEDMASIRDQRHHFIFHSVRPDELFDLSSDPAELRNLISRGEMRLARDLPRILADHLDVLGRQAAGREDAEFDPETLEELRQLGYVK